MDIPSNGIFGLIKVLLKPIIDFFSKLFFYRAYEISTLYHNHREAFGKRSHELTENIEYKVLWKPYYLRKKLVTPMIWIKAKDNNHFSKAVISVTAYNNKIKYQDQITLYGISNIPIQTALPSVPFRKLSFKNNMVYTPYDTITTKIQELHDIEGNIVELYYSREDSLTPFDRLEVALGRQKGDIEKWGEIFNLDFLEMELAEEKIHLIRSGLAQSKFTFKLRKKLFGINWIVKLIFWSKNIIFAKKLTKELVKYLEEHETHKKTKTQSQQTESA